MTFGFNLMQCFYILTADKEGQSSSKSAPISIEAFCLTLPGRILNVTALNYAKKFSESQEQRWSLTGTQKT